MSKLQISVVVPLFNEEESLPELSAWIHKVMVANNFTYELLFIDDGSTDNSWNCIENLKKENPNIRGIRFLRNYGKSAGLNTGFAASKGEVVITMDADLQDSPDEIPGLYKMITEEGFDLVSGWKQKRYDSVLTKNLPSKFFNFVTRKLSGISLNDFNCGLKAYKSQVVHTIEVYGEMHRYIPVIAKWTGFQKIGEKVVEHRARKYGETKFGLERFVNGFLDLLSITFYSRFRKRPMHFFGALGTVSFLLGFLFSGYIIAEKIYISNFLHQVMQRDVTGQPLFFLALTMLICGVQLFLAGFLAEMISRSSSGRNEYHVSEEI
ncbi:MAG: glycosyltransferase family 2 protein [Flammeovirgaceae bacterium]|nr:glycosyltransferase family 2 protein [Flammeovirgaceae bacterium]